MDSLDKENVDPRTFATPSAPSGQIQALVGEATPVVTTRARSRMLEMELKVKDHPDHQTVKRLLALKNTPARVVTTTPSDASRTLSMCCCVPDRLCNIKTDCPRSLGPPCTTLACNGVLVGAQTREGLCTVCKKSHAYSIVMLCSYCVYACVWLCRLA